MFGKWSELDAQQCSRRRATGSHPLSPGRTHRGSAGSRRVRPSRRTTAATVAPSVGCGLATRSPCTSDAVHGPPATRCATSRPLAARSPECPSPPTARWRSPATAPPRPATCGPDRHGIRCVPTPPPCAPAANTGLTPPAPTRSTIPRQRCAWRQAISLRRLAPRDCKTAVPPPEFHLAHLGES